jgi:hypothetical protein
MRRQVVTIFDEPQRRDLLAMLKDLSLEKPVRVTVENVPKKRSLPQNRLYWEWMEEAGNHLGHDKDEMDRWCKQLYDCPIKTINVVGVDIEVQSTRLLTTVEMAAYMDRCYRRLHEEGCILTTPEQGHDAPPADDRISSTAAAGGDVGSAATSPQLNWAEIAQGVVKALDEAPNGFELEGRIETRRETVKKMPEEYQRICSRAAQVNRERFADG